MKMLRPFILTFASSIHVISYAWTRTEYTGGSHYAEGSFGMSSENYSHFYCDNETKANKALNGSIDWRQRSTGDYCIFKNKNRPNSWSNGWERSRLTNGCRAQLEMFRNAAYQCWDHATDGGGNAISDQLNQDSLAAYKAWQDAYRARLQVIIERIDPQRRGLTAEIAALDADSSRFDLATRQDEEALALLIKKLENIAAKHERFVTILGSRQAQFETLLGRLKIALSNDRRDLEKIQQWTTSIIADAMAANATHATVHSLEQRHDSLAESCTLRVCTEGRASRELRYLRDFQATTWSLLDAYSDSVSEIVRDLPFAQVRATLEASVSRGSDAVAKMDQVFNSSSDAIMDRYPTCQSWARLPGALRLRRLLARVNATNEALGKTAAEFAQKWSSLVRQTAVADGVYALRRRALGLAGEFSLFLTRGQVSEAMAALANAESVLALDLVALEQSGLYLPDEMVTARAQIEQLLRPMRQDGNARLSLVGASPLVSHRLEELEIEIYRASDLVVTSESAAQSWEVVRRKIYQILQTDLDGPLYRPAFRTFDELIAYDRKISEAFDVLKSFQHELEMFL